MKIKATILVSLTAFSLSATAAHMYVGRDGLTKKSYHWPQATIPFIIPQDVETTPRLVGGSFTLGDQIRQAQQHWSEKTEGVLQFVEITQAEAANYPNYLRYRLISNDQCNHTGSLSFSGIYGMEEPGNGEENISFNTRCGPGALDYAIVLHEIGHAIGFHHESERPDRDNWVTVNKDNIQQGSDASSTYKTFSNSLGFPYQYKTYDPTSIMHYGPYFLSRDYMYYDEEDYEPSFLHDEPRYWDGTLDEPVFTLNADSFSAVMDEEAFIQLQRRWYENYLFGTPEVLDEEHKDILLTQLGNIPLYDNNPHFIDDLEAKYNGGTPVLPTISDLDAEATIFHYTGVDLRVKIAADTAKSRDEDTGFVDYKIWISNRSAWTAENVTITHNYKPSANFQFEGYLIDGVLVTSDEASGKPCTRDDSAGLLTCHYETLPPNTGDVIHLRLTAFESDSETFSVNVAPGFTVEMNRSLAGEFVGNVSEKSMHNETGGDLNPANNTSSTKMGSGGSLGVFSLFLAGALIRIKRKLLQ